MGVPNTWQISAGRHAGAMTARNRRLDRALHRSRELVELAAREVLLARETAGLSQAAAARAVGMSPSEFGRVERALHRNVTLEQLCRASAAVGLKASLRFYPDGDPVREVGQARLLERLRGRVNARIPWRTEVPLHTISDLRSWDAQLWFPDCGVGIEAETRIHDGQATWRRCAAKLRDDPTIAHVILLIADTPSNRRAVTAIRELLRPELPLDTRAILTAIGTGRCPGASGIVFL
jgi:transcriptional regulator with XRE-family HTH domain